MANRRVGWREEKPTASNKMNIPHFLPDITFSVGDVWPFESLACWITLLIFDISNFVHSLCLVAAAVAVLLGMNQAHNAYTE